MNGPGRESTSTPSRRVTCARTIPARCSRTKRATGRSSNAFRLPAGATRRIWPARLYFSPLQPVTMLVDMCWWSMVGGWEDEFATQPNMPRLFLSAFISLLVFLPLGGAKSASPAEPNSIEAASLNKEVKDFLNREVLAHLDEIKSYNPPP